MYNFSENAYDLSSVQELITVSYPERECVSVEVWCCDKYNQTFQFADIFYDKTNNRKVIKILIGEKEINFDMKHLLIFLNSSEELLRQI